MGFKQETLSVTSAGSDLTPERQESARLDGSSFLRSLERWNGDGGIEHPSTAGARLSFAFLSPCARWVCARTAPAGGACGPAAASAELKPRAATRVFNPLG